MKNYYEDYKRINTLVRSLNDDLSKMLCIHEMYYVYCEEYHTKPGFVISHDWFFAKMPNVVQVICEMTERLSKEEFDAEFKDSQMALEVIQTERIIKRLESLAKMVALDKFKKLRELFEERKLKGYEHGKIEDEDTMTPAERMKMAMRAPDPINDIVDFQIMLIGKITHYAFQTDNRLDTLDGIGLYGEFFTLFENTSQCEVFHNQLNVITNSMRRFMDAMDNTDEE